MSFSLRYLFALVALAAVYAAALSVHNQYWIFIAVNLTFAILLAVTIGVWLERLNRIFWLPFAVVGWFYLAIAFIPLGVSRFPLYLPGLQLVRVVRPQSEAILDSIRRSYPVALDGSLLRIADVVNTVSAVLFAAAAGGIAVLLLRQRRES